MQEILIVMFVSNFQIEKLRAEPSNKNYIIQITGNALLTRLGPLKIFLVFSFDLSPCLFGGFFTLSGTPGKSSVKSKFSEMVTKTN